MSQQINNSTISLLSSLLIYFEILPYHHFECTILKYSRNIQQAFNHFKSILWTSFYSTFHFNWSNINAERGPKLMLSKGLVFHSHASISILTLSTTSSTNQADIGHVMVLLWWQHFLVTPQTPSCWQKLTPDVPAQTLVDSQTRWLVAGHGWCWLSHPSYFWMWLCRQRQPRRG